MIEIKLVPFPFFDRWYRPSFDASCDGDVYLGRDLLTIDGERLHRFNNATRVAMALAALATLGGAHLRGVSINYNGIEFILLIIGALLITSRIAHHKNRNPRLAATVALLSECLLTPIVTGPFAYIASCYSGSDQTALIAHFDHWLTFDWVAYNDSLKAPYIVDIIFLFAYGSFDIQYLALPVLLLVYGYAGQARLLLNCFICGIIIVICIAMIVPTVDPLLWYEAISIDEHGYTGLARIDHLLKLRDGSMTEIIVKQLDGIICFPSFHAVAGCLFAAFAVALGSLRFVFLGLNALMLAVTPVLGGHYLVDVLAGIAIGVGLIAAAQAYTRRRPGADKILGLP